MFQSFWNYFLLIFLCIPKVVKNGWKLKVWPCLWVDEVLNRPPGGSIWLLHCWMWKPIMSLWRPINIYLLQVDSERVELSLIRLRSHLEHHVDGFHHNSCLYVLCFHLLQGTCMSSSANRMIVSLVPLDSFCGCYFVSGWFGLLCLCGFQQVQPEPRRGPNGSSWKRHNGHDCEQCVECVAGECYRSPYGCPWRRYVEYSVNWWTLVDMSIFGDIMAMCGAILYACSNLMQEYLVKSYDIVCPPLPPWMLF